MCENRNHNSPVRRTGDQLWIQEKALLDIQAVAGLLQCSPRHVYRLKDTGAMPEPMKLGSLVRWNRQEILEWINQGCPANQKRGDV